MVPTTASAYYRNLNPLLQEQRVSAVVIGEKEMQETISLDDDEEILKQDYGYSSADEQSTAESHVGGGRFGDFTRCGFFPLPVETPLFSRIAHCVFHGLDRGPGKAVMAIHRNLVSTPNAKARFFSFRVHEKAVAEKRRGGGGGGCDSNSRYAWYGGSRDEIRQILSFGFSRCTGGGRESGQQSQTLGVGVHLSAISFPADCLEAAIADDDGTKHLLLCRVLLGKMEAVPAGSSQSAPSSVEFDTGVDDLAKPRKYVVWSSFMNSHIYPAAVVSVKDPANPPGLKRRLPPSGSARAPRSPWMSFGALLSTLSGLLDRPTMSLVSKCYEDFKRLRITREQMIRKLRQLVGDELLVSVIKSHQKMLTDRGTKRVPT